jgi:hypothetical protein
MSTTIPSTINVILRASSPEPVRSLNCAISATVNMLRFLCWLLLQSACLAGACSAALATAVLSAGTLSYLDGL